MIISCREKIQMHCSKYVLHHATVHLQRQLRAVLLDNSGQVEEQALPEQRKVARLRRQRVHQHEDVARSIVQALRLLLLMASPLHCGVRQGPEDGG